MTDPAKHSLIEDAQGIAYGATMAAFGIVILTHLGLITGQTAGLAVLISYAMGWSFGPVFFVINLPFYVLGYLRMGWQFTLKTFASVGLLSALSLWLPQQVSFAALNPWLGAVLFGFLSGSALLALFRHGASLGGIGIVALMLQDRLGWRVGLGSARFRRRPVHRRLPCDRGTSGADQLPWRTGGQPGDRHQSSPRPLCGDLNRMTLLPLQQEPQHCRRPGLGVAMAGRGTHLDFGERAAILSEALRRGKPRRGAPALDAGWQCHRPRKGSGFSIGPRRWRPVSCQGVRGSQNLMSIFGRRASSCPGAPTSANTLGAPSTISQSA